MKRYEALGVGKKIGDTIYVHKSCEDRMNQFANFTAAKTALRYHYKNFKYDVIKYNLKDGRTSFIEVEGFDWYDEPIVRASATFNPRFLTFRIKQERKNPPIYHHKWLMVDESYKGFSMDRAMKRSEKIEAQCFDKKLIGRKDHWEKYCEPYLK